MHEDHYNTTCNIYLRCIVPKFVACFRTHRKNTFSLSFAIQQEKMLTFCRRFRINGSPCTGTRYCYSISCLFGICLPFDFLFIWNLPTIYKSMSLVLLLINTFCVCTDGFQRHSKNFHYRTEIINLLL
jgi:hypothetical protein